MPVQTKTDINRASREELIAIDGIGETMADAIIRYREQYGKFKSLEDLDKVPGIGESRIEYIKSSLEVGSRDESQSRQGSRQSSQPARSSERSSMKSKQRSEQKKSGSSRGHSGR